MNKIRAMSHHYYPSRQFSLLSLNASSTLLTSTHKNLNLETKISRSSNNFRMYATSGPGNYRPEGNYQSYQNGELI